jgi:hypothetical protein
MFKMLQFLGGGGRKASKPTSQSPSTDSTEDSDPTSQADEPTEGARQESGDATQTPSRPTDDDESADEEPSSSASDDPTPADRDGTSDHAKGPSQEAQVAVETTSLMRFAERAEALGECSEERLRALAISGLQRLEEEFGDPFLGASGLPDLLSSTANSDLEKELDAAAVEIERLSQELTETNQEGDRERDRLLAESKKAIDDLRARSETAIDDLRAGSETAIDDLRAEVDAANERLKKQEQRSAAELSDSQSQNRKLEERREEVLEELDNAAARVRELAVSFDEALGADDGIGSDDEMVSILDHVTEQSTRLLADHRWRREEMGAMGEVFDRATWRLSVGLQRRVQAWKARPIPGTAKQEDQK